MARRKRTAYFTPTLGRTIERIALAALAAIATRGEGESVALAALTIFVIVAVGEELGRGIVVRGRRVTIRDLALRRFAGGRFSGGQSRPRHRKRTSGTRTEPGESSPAVGAGDGTGAPVREPGWDSDVSE